MRWIDRERGAIVGNCVRVPIFRAGDVAKPDMTRGFRAGNRKQRAEMGFGFARTFRFECQRAERLARRLQIGFHPQSILERFLGKILGASLGERAAERQLDIRIVRREIRGATEMTKRGVEIVAFQQEGAQARQRLRIFARAQRDPEMGFRVFALAAQ
ncbi:MAG TPA: hypothetical protein VGO25_04770, partial [Rhodanobacteraceae bacterium]|nr:hypothetical protein [Rhodanobacteraceae bacterium]